MIIACDPVEFGFKAVFGMGLGLIFWGVLSVGVWAFINREPK